MVKNRIVLGHLTVRALISVDANLRGPASVRKGTKSSFDIAKVLASQQCTGVIGGFWPPIRTRIRLETSNARSHNNNKRDFFLT